MNSLSALFKNNLNKDIDQNFVDTLETMLFLLKPSKEEFNQEFDYTSQNVSSHTSISSYFNAKDYYFQADEDETSSMWSKDVYCDDFDKTITLVEKYNPTDFLILKLVTNLRRLYAFNKAKNRVNKSWSLPSKSSLGFDSSQRITNNEDNLLEQQKLIYKCFQLIDDFVLFKPKNRIFHKAILGQDVNILPIELWAYLGMHEYISFENYQHHLSIFKKHSSNFTMSASIIEQMSHLIHKPEKNEFLTVIFQHSDPHLLQEITFKNFNKKDSWILNLIQYYLDPKENVILNMTKKDQKNILNKIIRSKILDSVYLDEFINNKDILIDNFHNLYSSEEFKDDFKSLVSCLYIDGIGTTNTSKVVLKNITSLNDPAFFLSVIDSELNEAIKHEMYNFYDLSNKKLVHDIISKINECSSPFNKTIMNEFLSILSENITKETLAYILSLNTEYVEISKNAFLNLKLKESLSLNENSKLSEFDSVKLSKRNKI